LRERRGVCGGREDRHMCPSVHVNDMKCLGGWLSRDHEVARALCLGSAD